jgi:CheY-like chemotaxis protein
LPLPRPELLETSHPAPIAVAGQCHAQARRVLLVDDNQDSLQAMMRLVTALGHETHIAHDGLEAILVAENCRPEVILMDLGMPRMNGYDAACEIRARAWGRQIRLVAVTGWGQPANRQRTQAAGFDDHLVKPVDSDTLSRALAVVKADGLPDSRSGDVSRGTTRRSRIW